MKETKSDKTYLVTGGAGFIGSTLAKHLIKCGHLVKILDDFSTGREENCPPEAEIIRGDICDTDLMVSTLDGTDGCFHLAAIASLEVCSADPERARQVNRNAVQRFIDKIGQGHKKRPIVFASSSAIYGDHGYHRLGEDTQPQPMSSYACDKLANEAMFRNASQTFGLRVWMFRFFNVFGPGQNPDSPYSGVITLFMKRALQNRALALNGTGTQTRDFVHVDNVVTIMHAAMTRLHQAKHGTCRIHNIGTGKPSTIRDLAIRINQITNNHVPPFDAPARPGDTEYSLCDPDQVEADFGPVDWKPLDDYLKMAAVHSVSP